MIVTAGKTNVSVYYYIVGDAGHATPGEPVTGLLFSDIETGGSASYARQGAARVDLTLITLASASAAHADGGFILVDDTNMPGVYRCDYPDAAFATGVDQVVTSIVIASANNAVAAPIYVDITDVDLRDAVRGGMTALPNAAADAAGGLPISDAGGLDIDTKLGYLTAATSTASALATAQADLDTLTGADGAIIATGTQTFNMTGNVTGNVSGSVGSVTGAVGSVTGAVGSVTAEVTADMTKINGVAASAANLEQGAFALVTGSAITGTLTTTTFTTDLTEATDDHYNGRVVTFTSGVLAGQSTDITDYTGSTKLVTVTAMTETPGNADTFVIS